MPTPTAAALSNIISALSSLILQQINFMIHHRSTIYKQSVRLKGNDDNVDLIHLQIRVSIHPSAVKAILSLHYIHQQSYSKHHFSQPARLYSLEPWCLLLMQGGRIWKSACGRETRCQLSIRSALRCMQQRCLQ